MMPYARTFDSYRIAIGNLGFGIVEWIECYYSNDLVGKIYFTGYNDLEAGLMQKESGGDYIVVGYPPSEFDKILSLLRNERPLAIWYNKNAQTYGIVTASLQPVGG